MNPYDASRPGHAGTSRLDGRLLVGGETVHGAGEPVAAVDPALGERLEPAFDGADARDVEHACTLAGQAFDAYRASAPDARAALLERIADGIESLGPALIERAVRETGLPAARLEGERARTTAQLRLFARVVREGDHLDARIDPAQPARTPQPRPDLRHLRVPLGPVAVFGASNFPLAFSVAGGDTASALAAGCPVVVKAHPAHPGTSELVGRAVQEAVRASGLPAGVFALLGGAGHDVGIRLVADPHIRAVGFTGSRAGGRALMDVAARRPVPIPVYAEMSSVNPVFLLPGASRARAEALADAFAASLTLGAGQFCTNPGIVVAVDGPELGRFVERVARALVEGSAAPMLSAGIHAAYERAAATIRARDGVTTAAEAPADTAPNRARARLFTTSADRFVADPALGEEMFGPGALLVRCHSPERLLDVAEHFDGELTGTLLLDEDEDLALARELVRRLEPRVGRIVCNAFPTGVEVAPAMVHGGPWPATSDGRSTSVGTGAIERFLRPVCYQGLPDALLPEAVRDTNPLGLRRLVDGRFVSP